MLQLRTMNAADTEPLVVTHTKEATLHELFHAYRHHGEWFRVCEEMVLYLESINEPHAAHRIRLTMRPV